MVKHKEGDGCSCHRREGDDEGDLRGRWLVAGVEVRE